MEMGEGREREEEARKKHLEGNGWGGVGEIRL